MKGSIKTALVLLPVTIIIFSFFVYPVAITFSRSLEDLNGLYIGFERYSNLFSDPSFLDAFRYTLEISVISVLVSVVLAVITAFALRETFIGKRLTLFLYQTNISIPHIAIATMVVMLFSQTGLVSAAANNLGLINIWHEFPRIVGGDSPVGTIISYSLKFTPFIGISVLAILQSISRDYEDQSSVLGVGKIRTFFHITLPSITPAICSSAMIVFCFAFGSYDVPVILGRSKTLSIMAYNAYYNPYDPAAIYDAFAISIVIGLITISIAAIYLYISSSPRWRQTQ